MNSVPGADPRCWGRRGPARIRHRQRTSGLKRSRILLYFAYTARIAPDRLQAVAPGAEFQFIAHLPEWQLDFPIVADSWEGTLPNVRPASGSTVWGAVFEVPDADVSALDEAERAEWRVASNVEAMDRSGRRHQVTVHVHDSNGSGANGHQPSAEYLTIMLEGSRHWSLPAGWIAGLQEHLRRV